MGGHNAMATNSDNRKTSNVLIAQTSSSQQTRLNNTLAKSLAPTPIKSLCAWRQRALACAQPDTERLAVIDFS